VSSKKDRLSELGKINPIGAVDHRNYKKGSGSDSVLEGLPRSERIRLASGAKRIGKKIQQYIGQT